MADPTALTPVSPSLDGPKLSPEAANADGNYVPNPRGNVMLLIANASGGSVDVTIPAQIEKRPPDGTFPELEVPDIEITISNGDSFLIGPIPPAYNNSTGNVEIEYSAASDVTVVAIQTPAS